MISIPGRIPIRIFPFFWLLILMIGWLNSASILGTVIWSVVIFLSVLIHEYGHALTALAFGQRAEINLVGLGGLTKRHGPQLARWQEFLIVLNGPVAGFLLFIISYKLLNQIGEARSILSYAFTVAVTVNLFWTLLNLLPVLPLDGGHLLRILFEGAFGFRGLKLSLWVSIFLAVAIGLYFFLIQQILMGALFLMLAFESYTAWNEVKGMAPQDSSKEIQSLFHEGVEDIRRGNSSEALSKFNQVRQQAPKGNLYVNATQHVARILTEQGNLKQAYDLLLPIQDRLANDYLRFLQQLAYRLQNWEQAVQIGQRAYQKEPSSDVALMNALSYAIMGEDKPSVGWLRSAIQLGLKDVQNVIRKREFDSVRNSKTFQNWLDSYESGKSSSI